MLKKIVSMFLITCMVSATGINCFATTAGAQNNSAVNKISISSEIASNYSNSKSTLLSDKLISEVDPYISLNTKGSYYINDLSSLKKLLTSEELTIVKSQLKTMNQWLAESNLSLSSVSINQVTKSVTMLSSSKSSKEGVDKIDWKWYGARIYMSKATVTHILNAGVAGGGVALCVAFPGLGEALAIAAAGYVISEFGTGAISKPIYVDVTLNVPNVLNPTIFKIRGMGFQ